jgi:abhydrolase domain-containing protein 1/3
MNCAITEDDLISPYLIIFKSLLLIPISHYLIFFFLTILLFLYFFLEIHFPKADPISLTFNPNSDFCKFIVSKCRLLHGRYFPTFWLSSPHLQTAFLTLFGKSPPFSYKRILYQATDGGTIALDWLMHSDGWWY